MQIIENIPAYCPPKICYVNLSFCQFIIITDKNPQEYKFVIDSFDLIFYLLKHNKNPPDFNDDYIHS